MFTVIASNRFKKNFKLCLKRGLDEEKLKVVVKLLEKDGKLPTKFKPHLLKGKYTGLWECHIQPDWLLVWEQEDTIKLITLIATGTHADLF